jgi:predicted nucleic acid-binding protein
LISNVAGYLIDTNVISETRKAIRDPNVEAWFQATGTEQTYLSVLTIGEIVRGIERDTSPRRAVLNRWLAALEQQYAPRILPVDRRVAHKWGFVVAEAQAMGITLPAIDSLLAATALVHDLVVVTRDVNDFRGTGARLLNPWEHGR